MRLALAGAVASAVLLWLSAPVVGVGWLAWVALTPAAAVALARPEASAARLVVPLAYAFYLELLLVPALPFGLAEDQWGEPVLPILVGGSPVLVVALVVVPLFALLLWLVRFPQPIPSLPLLVAPFSFVALDFLRVRFDPGAFWGPLFLSQADGPAGLASLGGPWLVTLAVAFSGYGLAYALVRRRPLALAAPAAVGLALLVAPWSDGSGSVTVAAVQPGYDTAEFERPVLRNFRAHRYATASLDLIRDLAPLTRTAGRRGADIVVWPEAVVWVDPAIDAPARAALSQLAREARAALVVPFFLPGPNHGAAVVFDPTGRVTTARPKQRPMWFLGEQDGDRVEPEPVAAAGERVGTLLGVDNAHPEVSRELAAAGATLLASSTHDWRQLAPAQRAYSATQAQALARPLVRADWRYGSTILGPDGDVLADAGRERRRVTLVAEVATGAGDTPYTRIGDAVGWAALAGLLASFGAAVRRRASAGSRAPVPGAAR
jgi:apolipoprotein N-acyltransferase